MRYQIVALCMLAGCQSSGTTFEGEDAKPENLAQFCRTEVAKTADVPLTEIIVAAPQRRGDAGFTIAAKTTTAGNYICHFDLFVKFTNVTQVG